jgi:hypothetical protein
MTRLGLTHALATTLALMALPALAQDDPPRTLIAAAGDAACVRPDTADCPGDSVAGAHAAAQTQTVTVHANRPVVAAAGRASAPWHRSRGAREAAAPRR